MTPGSDTPQKPFAAAVADWPARVSDEPRPPAGNGPNGQGRNHIGPAREAERALVLRSAEFRKGREEAWQ